MFFWCPGRPPIRVTASPKKPRGSRVLSLGEMAFAAHKAANRNWPIRGSFVCPLDEAVGALTSTPEEGNGVLLGVPFPSCLRGVNHARHCMGHDVEFDDDSLKSQLHRNSFLFFFFAS